MITIRKILTFLAVVSAVLICSVSAYAYNVVDLPDSMTFADALGIYDANDIKSATVSNLDDDKRIDLSQYEAQEFFRSAQDVTLYRKINPTPFRGTAVNISANGSVKSFYFNSGIQIGLFGSENYICYQMPDYDLTKFMYLFSKYEESKNKLNGAELYRNTENDFLKLPEDLWAVDPIKEAASRSLLPYPLTAKYGANISREEFCVLIGNLIAVSGGYASLETYMKDNMPDYTTDNFADCIGKDASIDMLFALGIVSGKGGEFFDPDGCITREEAAKMLTASASRFVFIESDYKVNYKDERNISPWAKFFVRWVTEKGVMSGVDGENFEPQGTYTVQQAITTVSRLYNIIG